MVWRGSESSSPLDPTARSRADPPVVALQAYSILWATMSQFKKQNLVSESRVITIANLDVRLLLPPSVISR